MFAAVTVATAIAFFSMVGFEDSVNMVEETKEPERIFPRTMFTGARHRGAGLHAGGGLRGDGAVPIGDIQNFDGRDAAS